MTTETRTDKTNPFSNWREYKKAVLRQYEEDTGNRTSRSNPEYWDGFFKWLYGRMLRYRGEDRLSDSENEE